MCDPERRSRGGQAPRLSKAEWVISECDGSVLSHGGPVRGLAPGDGRGAGTSSSSAQPPGLHLHPDSGPCQPGTRALASSHIWGWPGGLPGSMATQGGLGFFPSVHCTCTWPEVAGGTGDPHVWACRVSEAAGGASLPPLGRCADTPILAVGGLAMCRAEASRCQPPGPTVRFPKAELSPHWCPKPTHLWRRCKGLCWTELDAQKWGFWRGAVSQMVFTQSSMKILS